MCKNIFKRTAITRRSTFFSIFRFKCLATIATVYWKSDERNLESEKDKTGRPPRFGDSVRADRVQGSILYSKQFSQFYCCFLLSYFAFAKIRSSKQFSQFCRKRFNNCVDGIRQPIDLFVNFFADSFGIWATFNIVEMVVEVVVKGVAKHHSLRICIADSS